jgi:hypothetical protein
MLALQEKNPRIAPEEKETLMTIVEHSPTHVQALVQA